MTDITVNAIPKVDYTTTPHPSGVKALSLKDAPALIEVLLPVQKVSVDTYKEQMAVHGKTLTSLGSYWKGRKPLVLNRACVLAALLPATDNSLKDLEIFEMLMGMDDVSISKRLGLPRPEEIVRTASIANIHKYFVVDPPEASLPDSAPFDLTEYTFVKGGKEVHPRLKWRSDVSETLRHKVASLTFEREAYRDLAAQAKRAEEVSDVVSTHIWESVNSHLGTKAYSFPELVEQLGVMRFGHRPRVADTFSGSGQIPFAAAQLGCDVFASDLNPVACMLTWGSFNIVGATQVNRAKIEAEQNQIIQFVKESLNALGVETDGNGWRARIFVYCLEVVCPSSGWLVPLLATRILSKKMRVIADLVPDPIGQRYDIVVKSGVSDAELKAAVLGTYREESVIHSVDGVEHRNKISAIRGDYLTDAQGKRVVANKVRAWNATDITFAEDDVYRERLYAIHWVKDNGALRPETQFRSVTEDDLRRERVVLEHVSRNIKDWQDKGWLPNVRIEVGGPPRYQGKSLVLNFGWTHWQHLFNPRQLLIGALLRQASTRGYSSVLLARLLNRNSRLCRWDPSVNAGSDVFYNQALNGLVSYASRGFVSLQDFLLLKEKGTSQEIHSSAFVKSQAAAQLDVVNDIYITDPPYGDAVKYEEIFDFFISWLRKNPSAEFANWTWDSRRELAVKGEDHDFRLSMIAAYKRMAEYMPDNGIQILMFTHQDGNIWADMANIVWASGLRVTAAWYLVTETDSALRDGSYVKGTILLVLRKRLGSKRTNQTDLAYELEEEVAEQIKRLTGMNDTVAADSNRAKDGNLFEDADLQMAGYAAALKVLTKYSIIDGKDMAQEALRPRVSGQKTLVESLIDFATDTANKMLVPLGLDESVWHELEPAERFYMKMLEQESHGLNKLDNY